MFSKMKNKRGSSLVELVIILPLLLVFVLGIWQVSLLYQARNALKFAALEAARAGAVNGADMNKIREGLADGLAPLFMPPLTGGGLANSLNVFKARLAAYAETECYATIEVLNPTVDLMNDGRFLAKQVEYKYIKQSNGNADPRYDQPSDPNADLFLINDNLMYRDHGFSDGLTIQDANVLKIKVTYQKALIVPVVDRMFAYFGAVKDSNDIEDIEDTVAFINDDPDYMRVMQSRDQINTAVALAGSSEVNLLAAQQLLQDTTGRRFWWRIPLVAYATVRMQTPIFKNEFLDSSKVQQKTYVDNNGTGTTKNIVYSEQKFGGNLAGTALCGALNDKELRFTSVPGLPNGGTLVGPP